MFLDKLQFRESTALCSSFGGELATPMNADEQETLFKWVELRAFVCWPVSAYLSMSIFLFIFTYIYLSNYKKSFIINARN